MKRFYLILSVFFLVEGTAYAHGQEVIFFPVGQVAAIILAIIASIVFMRRWIERTIAVLLTLAVCAWAWFIPGTYFPESLHSSGIGYFFEGFILPSIVTVFVALYGAIKRLR